MKAIAIINLKGGVGKTVTAVNMAAILAGDHHKRVLLGDCDSQCNTTDFFRSASNDYFRDVTTVSDLLLQTHGGWLPDLVSGTDIPGLDILPATDALMDLDIRTIGQRVDGFALRDLCRTVEDDDAYDYILFDCPPAFNAASAAALAAATDVIIPIKMDAFSIRGLRNVTRQIDNMHKINPNLRVAGALITMWRNVPVVLEAEASLRDSGFLPVFQTVIRRTDKVDEMTFERKPITVYSPRSAAGYDYRNFVQELLEPQITMDEYTEGGVRDAV